MSDATLRLLASFGDPHGRPGAARALAEAVGARAAYVFVTHPDSPAKMIPAPGFGHVLRSSHGWRDLLARCIEPGVHRGDIAFPDAATTRPATAYAFAGLAVVIVDAELAADIAADVALLAPLLAGTLRAEAALVVARGELEVAHEAAERGATLARALDAARANAERATRVKDEFLAMLGHELRNPLAPIVTALQMLRLDGIHTRAQDVLERQVAHVLRLVDDLLDVSRITRGKIELRKEYVEVSAVVLRALEMARPLLEGRRNDLVVSVPEGLVVHADPARLAQVVSNLVTNASKYADEGTQIRLVAEAAGTRVRIAVEDQGIGIDPAELANVFEQFTQMPQGLERAQGGLGLGLAIVRSLVELHGGSAHAESEGLGRGSRFVVQLPAARRRKTAPPRLQPVAPAARAARGVKLLLVDDNLDAAALLAEIMIAHGHEVRVAHTGPDALALLESFTPEAGIFDIGLPGIDGYELARRVRARVPGIQLIAVTGYGQPGDRKRTAEAGFGDHLVKPVSIASVTAALERLLR